jgi:hypothetical protein
VIAAAVTAILWGMAALLWCGVWHFVVRVPRKQREGQKDIFIR